MEQDDFVVEDIGVFQRDENIMNFRDKNDSRPTKEKVSAFKNRVFSLLLLFVEKAKDLTPILPLLTEQTFTKDPNRFREILAILINRDSLSSELLLNIAKYYKQLLLFKNKKDSQKFSEDFIKILRKIKSQNEEAVENIAQEMFESFILKRKCRLNVGFFSFLLKKMPNLRQVIVSKAVELQSREDVRPAQQRVLENILKTLTKSKRVKEEHQDEA